ncbi:ABC transporter ATP-binding protein [Tardiphaga sp. 804_B3_N1_9]|uniref:ABC transporter ATP-binding protein n=1 Tax=Tardiphaga sp. 804_B3_N1_9 TaxID=3240786 RepID=UPI003F29823A
MTLPATYVLSVRNLDVSFGVGHGATRAVRDVDLDVRSGETLALVGESGSGKSLTALSLMGLLPAGACATGSIRIDGREVVGASDRDWNRIRGRLAAIVFQNPMSCLNPVLTIGEQIMETIRRHQSLAKSEAKGAALELIDRMRLPDAERQFVSYPHELSGGMRQRVMLAIAVANRPSLLIADEPTTALDADVQGEILDLFAEIQRENGMAVLLITHDLGLVAERADRVAVMYAGSLVETRHARDLIGEAAHPYTRGLIAARPARRPAKGPRPRLADIPGQVPALHEIPEKGCGFAARCPVARDVCVSAPPPFISYDNGGSASCHALQPHAIAAE